MLAHPNEISAAVDILLRTLQFQHLLCICLDPHMTSEYKPAKIAQVNCYWSLKLYNCTTLHSAGNSFVMEIICSHSVTGKNGKQYVASVRLE